MRYVPSRQPTRRFQASATLTGAKRRTSRPAPAWLIGIAVAVGIAALAWYELSSAWRIQEVEVQSNAPVPLEAIHSAAALANTHFHKVDLDAAARRVNMLPGVAGAHITCHWEWRARCVIYVQPTLITAVWEHQRGLFWSDAQGRLQSSPGDVPALVRVRVIDGELPLQQNGMLSEATLRALQELAALQPNVRQYDYSATYGLIWQMDERWTVRLGDSPYPGAMHKKLQLAHQLRTALDTRGIRPKVIDVRYPNAPYYVR